MSDLRSFSYKISFSENCDEKTIGEFIEKLKNIKGIAKDGMPEIVDNELKYAIDEWASEYDVFSEILKASEFYGVEIELDDAAEDIKIDKINDKEENVDATEDNEDEEKKEKKVDFIEKIIVLGLSAVLLIVGLIISNAQAKSWIFMLSFAFAGYETLYDTISKVVKKQYVLEEILIIGSALVVLYTNRALEGCLIMIFYSCLTFGEKLIKSRADNYLDKLRLSDDDNDKKALEALEKASGDIVPENEKVSEKRFKIQIVFVILGALIAFIPPFFNVSRYGELLTSKWLYIGMIVISLVPFESLLKSVFESYYNAAVFMSKKNIYMKNFKAFLDVSEIEKVVFDKTGVITANGCEIKEILSENVEKVKNIFLAAEEHCDHPIASAAYQKYGKSDLKAENVEYLSGFGIICKIGGKKVAVGNKLLMVREGIKFAEYNGVDSPVYVSEEGKYIGTVVVGYTVKNNAYGAIKELEEDIGIFSEIVSSDSLNAVNEIKRKIDAKKAIAGASDKFKLSKINDKKTLYVGNAITDVEVLNKAEISYSLNGITDKASVSSLAGEVKDIPSVVKLAKRTKKICKQNFMILLISKIALAVIGVCLAAVLSQNCIWYIFLANCVIFALLHLNAMRNLTETI